MTHTAERKRRIEALALGRRMEPWHCGCGACSHPAATVVAITHWEFDQDKSYAWSAQMRDDAGGSYSCTLDFVLTREELAGLFPEKAGS